MWRHIEAELQLCSADQEILPKQHFIFYTLSASSTSHPRLLLNHQLF